eukprot:GHVS01085740.1.p1 GENE.GHVS01085740.1~~GHVS01085740.1.p1  ORF type:complete len:542 (-),score=68.35 GHVS01085740.1:318-1856(-)
MAAFAGSSSFFQPFSADPPRSEEPFIEPPQISGLDNKELQEQMEKRILMDDMASCGIVAETHLSADDLSSKLQKSKRSYNDESVRRVYASLASYQTSLGADFVTGRQFCEAYMKRKRELHSVLDNTMRELDLVDKMLQQSQASLKKYSAQEMSSPQQIADESKLTVQVVSVQNIADGGEDPTCMYKIHLECQNQVIDTRAVYENASIAYFNEMFSFQITSRQGDLRVKFQQVEPYSGQETPLGECSVMVEDLGDQRKHELTKEIWGAQRAELLLSCQWIYSKKLLYQQYLREFSAKREQKLKDLVDYQNEYDKLNQLFEVDGASGTMGLLESGPEYVSRAIEQVMQNMKLTNWQVASQYVVTITFVLVCIASYTRCLFLDQVVSAFAFWCNLDARRWSVSKYTSVVLLFILSVLLDFSWMNVYYKAWTLNSTESDFHAVSKVFSFFLCAWKVVVILFFWKCGYDMKKKSSYQERLTHAQAISRQSDLQERQHARMERMDAQPSYTLLSNQPQ